MFVPKLVKDKLKLEKEVKKVIEIKRVLFLEKKAFAYTVNYLPIEIGMKISEKDLYKKPLLEILEKDFATQFSEAFQTIQASFSDREVSEQLGIAGGSPILFVERIMYTKNSNPVELVQSSYRGDLYKYIVRLKKVKEKDM